MVTLGLRSFAAAVPISLLLFAAPAGATDGVVDLSWDTCSPVVTNLESPAAGPLRLIVSVLGNDQTHNAYQVGVLIHGTDDTVPDAWRFDMAGCQVGGDFNPMSPVPPAALLKSCPPFKGSAPYIQLTRYEFVAPPGEYAYYVPSTWMVCRFFCTYPAGNTTVATQRYHLANIVFDHTFSVAGPGTPGETCGGFDLPIILTKTWRSGQFSSGMLGSYLRMQDGVEIPFDFGGNQAVVVNGSLPARESTWGQIKSVYRR